MKSAIVFIDANNWYHNVKRFFKYALIDNACDVCLLISGDADFVPALELIKKQGKEVLTAMVPWGYSSEIRRKFPFFILRNETLRKCLKT